MNLNIRQCGSPSRNNISPSKNLRRSPSPNSALLREQEDEKVKQEGLKILIERIWDKYDVDRDGVLNYAETSHMVQTYLESIGFEEEFCDKTFSKMFKEFDKDNSGTIEKDELILFMESLIYGEPPKSTEKKKKKSSKS